MRNESGRQRGFSLIELVVVLAVLAILVAVLTPMIGRYVEDSRMASAKSDVQNIAAAINNFNRDTSRWPFYQPASAQYTGSQGQTRASLVTYGILISPTGNIPAISANVDTTLLTSGTNGYAGTNVDTLTNQLMSNSPGGGTGYPTAGAAGTDYYWRGPYIQGLKGDPWGNRYTVNAGHFADGDVNSVFVISAGPNGVLETKYDQAASSSFVVGGDDIVYRIK